MEMGHHLLGVTQHTIRLVVDDAQVRLCWCRWDVHLSYSLFSASLGVRR